MSALSSRWRRPLMIAQTTPWLAPVTTATRGLSGMAEALVPKLITPAPAMSQTLSMPSGNAQTASLITECMRSLASRAADRQARPMAWPSFPHTHGY
jgi:hypothetical protein